MPIDSLGWEFSFIAKDSHISGPPKDGAYISGFYLEGAKWDNDKNYLVDAEPMKLHYEMPIIHFKPTIIEGKRGKKSQNLYLCPCYMYPIRQGERERPSF